MSSALGIGRGIMFEKCSRHLNPSEHRTFHVNKVLNFDLYVGREMGEWDEEEKEDEDWGVTDTPPDVT